MSSVHYKFRSSKDYDTITFEGAYISVGELKSLIASKKKLGRATDYDLQLVDAQTGDTFPNDQSLVPRNTSIIVSRTHSTRPAGFQAAELAKQAKAEAAFMSMEAQPNRVSVPVTGESEEDQNLREVMTSGWNMPRRPMHTRVKYYTGESKIPPKGYICHRCNQPGHYINQCPTNGDPNFDFHKVRPATGIPRSFLKRVEAGSGQAGTLRLPNGSFAVMEPNASNFETITKAPPEEEEDEVPSELTCPLCKKLLKQAVIIQCCETVFCESCIMRSIMSGSAMACPECNELASTDDLETAKAIRRKVDEHLRSVKKKTLFAQVQEEAMEKVKREEKKDSSSGAAPSKLAQLRSETDKFNRNKDDGNTRQPELTDGVDRSSNRACFVCNEPDHIARFCPKGRGPAADGQSQSIHANNMPEDRIRTLPSREVPSNRPDVQNERGYARGEASHSEGERPAERRDRDGRTRDERSKETSVEGRSGKGRSRERRSRERHSRERRSDHDNRSSRERRNGMSRITGGDRSSDRSSDRNDRKRKRLDDVDSRDAHERKRERHERERSRDSSDRSMRDRRLDHHREDPRAGQHPPQAPFTFPPPLHAMPASHHTGDGRYTDARLGKRDGPYAHHGHRSDPHPHSSNPHPHSSTHRRSRERADVDSRLSSHQSEHRRSHLERDRRHHRSGHHHHDRGRH